MDATTVQEIANQLGIGVNELLQYLPGYAQSQFLGFLIPISILLVITIISIIVFVVFSFKYRKYSIMYRKSLRISYDRRTDEEDRSEQLMDFYQTGCWITGALAGVLFVTAVIVIPVCIGPMLCWANSPELMLLKSLIPG